MQNPGDVLKIISSAPALSFHLLSMASSSTSMNARRADYYTGSTNAARKAPPPQLSILPCE